MNIVYSFAAVTAVDDIDTITAPFNSNAVKIIMCFPP